MAGIDAAVAGLDAALRVAGLRGVQQPDDTGVLDHVETALAPYRLPAELRCFWELVRLDTLAVECWPPLFDAATSLEVYEIDREFGPLFGPPLLLPIGGDSDARRLIELESEWSAGGTVFYVSSGTPFRIEQRTFADLVGVVAEGLHAGDYQRHGDIAFLDYEAQHVRAAARLGDAPADPVYGEAVEVPKELTAWPAHWLAAAGIRLEDRVPLGATHTIAELVREAAAAPVRGRIAGEVVSLVGIGTDIFVVVDDGSAQVDVLCPAGTSVWGPSHRRRFEFHVTLDRPPARPPDDTPPQRRRPGADWTLADAQAAAARLLGRGEMEPPSAIACDVRPLDSTP